MTADAPTSLLPRGCLVASAAALGHALQIANGFYDDRALLWLTVSFVLALAGVCLPRWALALPRGEDLLRLVAVLAIGWQLLALLTANPGMYLLERTSLAPFKAGVAAEAALIAVGAAGLKRAARAWFPILLALHVALGIWMIRASPSPRIDVVTVHREAFNALRQGRSPYAVTFENIYPANLGFYNRELVNGERVMFGYPYPPLSLLLSAPGQLAGDYRYAQLAAWIAAAAFVGYLGPALFCRLVATLLLTHPRGFFVIEQGWTEPIGLLMMALTVYAMAKRPRAAAWAGGLLMVTKQYLAIAALPLWRFAARRRDRGAFVLRACAVAALVTLPFALWQLRPFLESVVILQTREPFRFDSLSFLSWAVRHNLATGSFAWALGAGAVGLAIGMIVTPNTPAGFAAALTLSTFSAFAFGSKAFCNYYFFVAGGLCCAAAALAAPCPPSDEVALR